MVADGRRPITVNQPPAGGSDYPFVNPSSDITQLLGDLYLSYRDRASAYVFPFHVQWMYGFGDNVVAPPAGYPSPTHDHDIIIVDNNGTTVFDSTTASSYTEVPWASRLLTIEWQTDTDVLRLTKHTAWSDNQTPKVYDLYIEPTNGELDGRTYNRLPSRVDSIDVNSNDMTGDIILKEENNIRLEVVEVAVTEGGRNVTQVRISAIPGAGQGKAAGCDDDTVKYVSTVNGAEPDANGNLKIDVNGCYRNQRTTQLTSTAPRQVEAYLPNLSTSGSEFGVDLSEILPYSEADTEPELRTLLENPENAVRLFNDCSPCCDCDDYVNTYEAMRVLYSRYKAMGQQAEAIRDQFQANIERWEDRRENSGSSLKLTLVQEFNCKTTIGGIYCNPTECSVLPMVLRLTMKVTAGGADVNDLEPEIRCQAQKRAGTDTDYEEVPFEFDGAFPVYDIPFERVDPFTVSRFYARLLWPSCEAGQAVTVWLSVHYDEPDGDCNVVDSGDVDVPTEVQNLWTTHKPAEYPVRAITSKVIGLTPASPE